MPEVNVTIDGRSYRMACGDGEEAHLSSLGADLDRRVSALKQHFGEVGDARLLIMAALTLSDELSELRKRQANTEQELNMLRTAHRSVLTQAGSSEAQVAKRIDAIAASIERLVSHLDQLDANDSEG